MVAAGAGGASNGRGSSILDNADANSSMALSAMNRSVGGGGEWSAFDPDADEGDNDYYGDNADDSRGTKRSRVSDVELVRGALDASGNNLSVDQQRRLSGMSKDGFSYDGGMMGGDDGMMLPDDMDDAFGDNNVSNLSRMSGGTEFGGVSGDGVGGLDDSVTSQKAKRKRKRRKIVIDNDKTELSSDEIKRNLSDTSKIIGPKFDPRGVVAQEGNDVVALEDDDEDRGEGRRGIREMTWEERLVRPCLGDDGMLAPELLRLWARTLTTDGTTGWRMRRSVRRQLAMARMDREREEKEDDDEVENARQQQNANDDDMGMMMDDGGASFMDASNNWGAGIGGEDHDDVMMPAGDETVADVMGGYGAFDDNAATYGKSEMGGESFSLRAVNDIAGVDDDDDNNNNNNGEADAVDTRDPGQKWHPHTTKVLDMLRRNMEGQHSLSYDELSKGCSRRTAAGVFFELLQLKSWNFVEIQQQGPYGDIVISKGAKFAQ